MIWSRLPLAAKLLAAVLMPVLLVVVLMVGALTYNMRNGFEHYLLETELQQLDSLAQKLATSVDSWPLLAAPEAWARLVEQHQPHGGDRAIGPRARPPGPPPGPPGPDRLPQRLILIAPDGQVIAGRAQGESYADLSVPLPDGPSATLRLFGRGAPSSEPGRLYLSRQLRAMQVITAIAVLVAALVAFLTARQFLRPIHEVARHVARLAAGDLEHRLTPRSQDELGRMMADQNALAEGLNASRERERQWVSDTSHELKTPLAVLQAEIEALQDGVRRASPETLATMHGAVRRLSALIDDLRLLASSDEARLSITPARIDLSRLVTEAAASAHRAGLAQGLALTIAADDPVFVRADAGRMRQVLDNLLDNACRYTDRPGRICVTCRPVAGSAEIVIADTAPRPDERTLPAIFDRFRRGEISRSRDHGGSGLGLAICRSLLAAQGGTISAAPSDLGGLRICLHLPLAEPAP
ncbi:ATP-binding protein [Pseudooceanicola aestuarii]|uniref:ATP-binding protein n=1 Tax=Pseudooceanicola aestuarii TaxID=2697319 RepID=UPI0013D250E1|nr:ATP-binding protein [Pseudooceanicola aestuarii]